MEVLKHTKVKVPLLVATSPDGKELMKDVELTVIAALKSPYGIIPDYVSTDIIETGKFFEETVVFDIIAHLKPGMLFVDVGANLGTFTAAARAVGAETISIEPQPILQASLKANAGKGKIFAVGAGTSKEKMTVFDTFMRHPNRGVIMANLGGNDLLGAGGRQPSNVQVEIKKLDTMLKGTKPDVIKIDVEGMERDVLESGLKIIAQHKPILYLEQNHGYELAACYKILKPLGYYIAEVLGDEFSSTVIRYEVK